MSEGDSSASTLHDLLNEIQNESALQLFNTVLHDCAPLGSTGLPSLDAQLSFVTASPGSIINRGDVLEFQGPSASGKTQLTYRLAMKCILPKDVPITFLDSGQRHVSCVVDVGGWQSGAIVLDCDGRWEADRVRHLLFKRLRRLWPPDDCDADYTIKEVVTESLKRLHIFRPSSTVSLAYTLLHLPVHHARCMPNLEISLLIIDSMSSFYWQDRYSMEEQRAALKKDVFNPMNHVLTALQEFRLNYGPVTVLTNWALIPVANPSSDSTNQQNASSPFFRQHLYQFPAPFEIPVRVLPNAHLYPPITHHITLTAPKGESIPLEANLFVDAQEVETQMVSGRTGEITGIIRSVQSGMSGNFTFLVNPNHAFV